MYLVRRAAAAIAFFFTAGAASACDDDPLVVFAAASLTDAVHEIADTFSGDTGCAVSVSVAGSGTHARQIAQGAPADIFLSANTEWVEWLHEESPDRVAAEPVVVARNSLVAVGTSDTGGGDLAEILSPRFAIGDPGHVPAGIYAKAALQSLDIWDDVRPHAVFTENVRVALSLAARGEVGAAIVYATDAMMNPDLAVTWRFDPATHPPIVYEAVLLDGGGDTARTFLDMLSGRIGRDVLARYGFRPGPGGTEG